MFLRTEHLAEKKLVGKRRRMSLVNNRTKDLWQCFMPERKQIRNNVGTELYSVEVYDPGFFKQFDPHAEFDKWAAVEVTDFELIPGGMEALTLPAGLYAVFLHKGPASDAVKTYEYIFKTWLPASDFLIDDRPHFALMGEKYKNDSPDSEEEIWIPVKPRGFTASGQF